MLGPLQFRDRNRWMLASLVIYPLIPFTGIAGHAAKQIADHRRLSGYDSAIDGHDRDHH